MLVPGAGLSPGLPSPTAAAAPVGGSPSPATRPSRREGYTRFSRAEEAALSAGVLEYGAGSWKKILGAYPDFHPKRTPVCLKVRGGGARGERAGGGRLTCSEGE